MPIYIRRGNGTKWIHTNKVYVWRGGRWLRVYGAYVWSTQFNQARWWPMFLFEQLPPPPAWVSGVTGNHSLAHIRWAPTTDETVLGHRVIMRNGSSVQTWPSESQPMFPVGTTEMIWSPLALDTHYTFTVRSYDEFGRWGPESAPLHYWTGHPEVLHNNPSYYVNNGYDWFVLKAQAWHNVAPLGTRTWRHGANKWIGNWNVEQGIPKAAPAATGSIGVISYNTAYEQVCHAFGLNPPRGAIVVNRDVQARILQITRNVVKEKAGHRTITVMPGWTDFWHAPGRMQWAWEAMTFLSPAPGGTKGVDFDSNPTRLAAWVRDWIRLETGTNAMVIADDSGPKDDDGTNYVSFAPANPWQSPGDSWAIQCQVRFQYADPPYDPPKFW